MLGLGKALTLIPLGMAAGRNSLPLHHSLAGMKNTALKILAWLMLAAIVFVTVSPIEWRPPDILPVDVGRALACALFAGLFVVAYPRQWFWIGATMIVGAGLIELLQLATSTRHARVDDALVKAAGAFIGVGSRP